MEKMERYEIFNEFGLSYKETTSESNGYPKNLEDVALNLGNWADASELLVQVRNFIKENNQPYVAQLISLSWRAGQQLPTRGRSVNEPYKTSPELYGDDYMMFDKSEDNLLDYELRNTIKERIDGGEDFDDVIRDLNELQRVKWMLDDAEPNEVFIWQRGTINNAWTESETKLYLDDMDGHYNEIGLALMYTGE